MLPQDVYRLLWEHITIPISGFLKMTESPLGVVLDGCSVEFLVNSGNAVEKF